MTRAQPNNKNTWASRVLALIQGGNTAAAISQIKVAPSVKDLRQLQAALTAATLKPPQPHVRTVVDEQIALLSAPRLHRSP